MNPLFQKSRLNESGRLWSSEKLKKPWWIQTPGNTTNGTPSAAKSNAVNAGVILKGKSYSKANLMKPCSGAAPSIS